MSALRNAVLAVAHAPPLERLVRRHGMRLGASRFVAGETLDEAVVTLRRLNERGLRTNTSLLGEHVEDPEEAARVTAQYEEVLRRIAEERLDTNLAIKLTHLGLGHSEETAHDHVARLVDLAQKLGNFVRIDMEDSSVVDVTLRIYRRLREAGRDNVGVVLQSYLYRSESDLESLLPLGLNVRLVKGAYLEPAGVAYPRKEDVDAAFVRLLERSLVDSAYTAVATHDERLIEHAIAYAERRDVARGRFEFQMLFGVRPQLQLGLVRRGFAVRVATPYGPDWYPYLMRRLAERPANALFLLRNAIRK